jgi:hypothetical protein
MTREKSAAPCATAGGCPGYRRLAICAAKPAIRDADPAVASRTSAIPYEVATPIKKDVNLLSNSVTLSYAAVILLSEIEQSIHG